MTGTNPDSEPESTPTSNNWQVLTEKTRLFAGDQVARHYWRGAPGGVLPDGFDADSIADHVVAQVCQERSQITDRTPDDAEMPALQHDLQRRVRREVDRLHHRKENFLLVNEPDLAPIRLDDGEHVSPIQLVEDPSPHPDQNLIENEADAELDQFKQEFRAFLGPERRLRNIFELRCAGLHGRKPLADKLKLNSRSIKYLNERLKRRLTEFLQSTPARQRLLHNPLISSILNQL